MLGLFKRKGNNDISAPNKLGASALRVYWAKSSGITEARVTFKLTLVLLIFYWQSTIERLLNIIAGLSMD